MTDQELVLALADRLLHAFWSASPKIPTKIAVLMASTKQIDSDLAIDVAWRAVASECLRQMQWARLVFYPIPDSSSMPMPITIAPTDWLPDPDYDEKVRKARIKPADRST